MNILAFDTTMSACSAAVLRSGTVLAERFVDIRIGHAENLIPMIIDVLEEASITFEELDGIGVTRGPGTFAGVRIGIATAKGIAMAANKPLLGVISLDAIAAGLSKDEVVDRQIISVIDARRSQCYIAVYRSNFEKLLDPAALDYRIAAETIKTIVKSSSVILIGTGSTQLAEELEGLGIITEVSESDPLPRASVIARVVYEKVRHNDWPSGVISPLYLRDSGATSPKQTFLKNA